MYSYLKGVYSSSKGVYSPSKGVCSLYVSECVACVALSIMPLFGQKTKRPEDLGKSLREGLTQFAKDRSDRDNRKVELDIVGFSSLSHLAL